MNPGMLAVCAFPWSHFTPILPKALGGGTTYRIPEFLSYCTLQNAEFGTNIFICILCVQVFSVCVHHEPVVPSKMRRGCQIPLELEVQMVVGCCVDAVIKPQLSARAANAFNLCSSIINHFYLAFHSVAQDGLKLAILPQPLECWHYGLELPCLDLRTVLKSELI